MTRLIVRRLIATLPVLFAATTLTFFLVHLVPGDPVDVMLGENAPESDKRNLRAELGLDRPLFEQYTDYLSKLTRFDLGTTLLSREPVAAAIGARVPA
ncbi:MAG: ABC transporter permease, partial [Bdellovibrionia bacterium]